MEFNQNFGCVGKPYITAFLGTKIFDKTPPELEDTVVQSEGHDFFSDKMCKLRSKKIVVLFFFEQRIDPHRFCATCGSATEHLLPAICEPLFKFPLFGPIVDPDLDIF